MLGGVFANLVGDNNFTGAVTTSDYGNVKQRLGSVMTFNKCKFDVNVDGGLSVSDAGTVKQHMDTVAADCP